MYKFKKKSGVYKNDIVKWWFEIFKPTFKRYYKNIEIERAIDRKKC